MGLWRERKAGLKAVLVAVATQRSPLHPDLRIIYKLPGVLRREARVRPCTDTPVF